MPRFELIDFEPTRPLDARGGIRAQSRRGGFGRSWWARRWIETLESFNIGARLGRGRSYARRGQVLSIEIEDGMVTASVQGSRVRPYRVTVNVETLAGADWGKLIASLSEHPIFMAQLLSGRMPEDIEDIFRDAGLSLFPDRRSDLETDCSCPDWSNPCKHIAAVYLLLGEEFDRDPFLIFRLRGMDRERLLGLFDNQATENETEVPGDTHGNFYGRSSDRSPPEPLSPDPEEFWGADNSGQSVHSVGSVPTVSAALPKRLGAFPFWRGEDDFLTVMEDIYGRASPAGLEALLPE